MLAISMEAGIMLAFPLYKNVMTFKRQALRHSRIARRRAMRLCTMLGKVYCFVEPDTFGGINVETPQ